MSPNTSATLPKWTGVFAATPTTFHENGEVDYASLGRFMDWMATRPGVAAVVVNTHGGEGVTLTLEEAMECARTAVRAVNGRIPVLSALLSEGIRPAQELGRKLESCGVNGFLVMPPHRWLRGGKTAEDSAAYIAGVVEGTTVPLIIHEYPAWTKAGYTTEELLNFARMDRVVGIKSGPRDGARFMSHIEELGRHAPHVTIMSCHDEAVLPSILPGVEGVLMTIGSVVAQPLDTMLKAVAARDMTTWYDTWLKIRPLTNVLYKNGIGARSHAMTKCALALAGILPNFVSRLPEKQITPAEVAAIEAAMIEVSDMMGAPELAPRRLKAA